MLRIALQGIWDHNVGNHVGFNTTPVPGECMQDCQKGFFRDSPNDLPPGSTTWKNRVSMGVSHS